MIRVFVVLIPFMTLVACDKESPPTAPAGKASDFDDFFDFFNNQSQADDQQSSSEPDTTKSQAEPDAAQDTVVVVVDPPEDAAQDTVVVVVDPPEDAASTFDIELIFLDDFTESEKQVMTEMAAYWEDRLSDIPDYRLRQTTDLSCGGRPITLERGRVIDDVIVYVSKIPKERRPAAGIWGVRLERPTKDRLPAAGCVMIGDWENGALGTSEHKAFVQEIFLAGLNSVLDALRDDIEEPVVDLSDNDTFDIEMIFLDEFTALEKQIMVKEVEHWEKMLGDIPGYRLGYETFLPNCGDHPIMLERGRVIDDVIMYVAKIPKNAPPGIAGTAAVWMERPGSHLPAVGCVMMGDWKKGPLGTNEHKAFVQDVFLHEMGHALGIGSGHNWQNFVVWEEDRSGAWRAHFAGASAIAAYDGLPRLIGPDPDAPSGPLGGPSRALVTQPGGVLYTGNKVPLLGDGAHWGETIGGELVAYDPVVEIDRWPKLSVISLGAMEDMGYPVRYENADPFWVELDTPSAGKANTSFICGVGQGFLNH